MTSPTADKPANDRAEHNEPDLATLSLHDEGLTAAAAVILDRDYEDNRASSRSLDDLTPATQARYRLFARQVLSAYLHASGPFITR